MYRLYYAAGVVAATFFGVSYAQYDLTRWPCGDMMAPILLPLTAYRDCELTALKIGDCAMEALAALSHLGFVLDRDDCRHEIESFLQEKTNNVLAQRILSIPVNAAACHDKEHDGTSADVCIEEAGKELFDAVNELIAETVPLDSADSAAALASLGDLFHSFIACVRQAPLLVSTVRPDVYKQAIHMVTAWKLMIHKRFNGAIDLTSAQFLDFLLGVPGEGKASTGVHTSLKDVRTCKSQWLQLKNSVVAMLQSPLATTALDKAESFFRVDNNAAKWKASRLSNTVSVLLNESSCVFEWQDKNDLEACNMTIGMTMQKHNEMVSAQKAVSWSSSYKFVTAVSIGVLASFCLVGTIGHWLLVTRRNQKTQRYSYTAVPFLPVPTGPDNSNMGHL